MSDEGEKISAGSLGTVVGVWAKGQAYEVEFVSPTSHVVTVERKFLRHASE